MKLYHTTSVQAAEKIKEEGVIKPKDFDSFVSFSEIPFTGDISGNEVILTVKVPDDKIMKVEYTKDWYENFPEHAAYIAGQGWYEQFTYPDECFDEDGFEDEECMEEAYKEAEFDSFFYKSNEKEWVAKEKEDIPVNILEETVVQAKKKAQIESDDLEKALKNNTTITLYHRTTPEVAEQIAKTKNFKSLENTGNVYFSSRLTGENIGYGSAIISIDILPQYVQYDDLFPSGEVHVTVPPKNFEYIKNIKRIANKKIANEISYGHTVTDFHDGQTVGRTYAYDTTDYKTIGFLDYSEYDEKIYIDYIEVLPDYRRQGVAEKLIKKLLEEYPEVQYNEIEWGTTTTEGTKLQEHMNKLNVNAQAVQALGNIEYYATAPMVTEQYENEEVGEVNAYSVDREFDITENVGNLQFVYLKDSKIVEIANIVVDPEAQDAILSEMADSLITHYRIPKENIKWEEYQNQKIANNPTLAKLLEVVTANGS